MSLPSAGECACVVVTYNPDPPLFQREFDAIRRSGWRIFIVDNASAPPLARWVQSLGQGEPAVSVISMESNAGIARALNVGLLRAVEAGCRFALLLDHDSVPSPDLLGSLHAAARARIEAGDHLAAIGARLLDPRSGDEPGFCLMSRGLWRRARCRPGDDLVPCEFLNSSGSFLVLDAWKDIGPFRESFFIDHVETEWYMRARAAGYRCYGLCSGRLEHRMGDDVVSYWLLGRRSMPRRSPQRHYTIVRNALWMYRQGHVPLAWKLNNLAKIGLTLCFFSLFDREGSAQFRCILRGVQDGLRGEPKSSGP